MHDSGTLIYVAGPAQTTEDVSLVLADRAGTVTPLKVESDRYGNARVSPDGARLAVDTDDGKEANVYLYELSGTRGRNRLTFGGRSQFPVWSPDGQRVAFQSDREGDRAIFAQRIDGTGLTRLTTAPKEESHIPESWSRDGHLLFSILKEGSYTLWTLSIADGKTARFGDTVSSEPTGAVFTSDGRWVTYHSLPPGALRLARTAVFSLSHSRPQAPAISRSGSVATFSRCGHVMRPSCFTSVQRTSGWWPCRSR